MTPLHGKVAVVAGATRGAGRGIARMLGEAGATVYCTGRSSRGHPATAGRPETIEDTAELVTAGGGTGIAVRVDHTSEPQVRGLFENVRGKHGRLDVLVNDIWGGDTLTEWGVPFWELSVDKGLEMMRGAITTHIITARHGVPLMIDGDRGLIVEVTDGDFAGYRGNLYYDFCKAGAIRLAYAMAAELRGTSITALAVTPGFLRSEAMLDHFGVREDNWRDAIAKDPHFAESETPCFVGRAVAALASDPAVHHRAGRTWASWTLARDYGFDDIDGRRPDWGAYFADLAADILDRGGPADAHEEFLLMARFHQVHLDPVGSAEAARIDTALAKWRAAGGGRQGEGRT